MSLSAADPSDWLLSFSLTLSSQHVCVCMHPYWDWTPSFHRHSITKTEGVATRWLNKHIAQLPITQIHLVPSCQHVSHSFTTSHVFCVCRGEASGRKGGGQKKENNAEIMRITKKFLGGVFNFNHQAYPSSVALISPSFRSLPQVYWNEGE